MLQKLIQCTQHLKSGIPSPSVCRLILADRGIAADYNLVRRLVNGVLAWRKQRIKDGFSEEKVGVPAVDNELITLRSKGKLVARKPDGTTPQPKKSAKNSTEKTAEETTEETTEETVVSSSQPKVQPVIHSRRNANYGR